MQSRAYQKRITMAKMKRKAAAKPRKSNALVRVSEQLAKATRSIDRAVRGTDKTVTMLVERGANGEITKVIDEDFSIGALGLAEVKLTEAEEKVLARPFDEHDILIKPTGQPFVSHPAYTLKFNEAFGRTGWALVPIAKPSQTIIGKTRAGADRVVITCPYVLHIHKMPVAFAMGEQEFYSDNREQTFGDALEATNASALRRCAKRLGIGLELWDKRYLRKFTETHCILVARKNHDRAWRRRDDPQFADEYDPKTAPPPKRSAASTTARPPVAHHAAQANKISRGQVTRLFAIIGHSGRSETEVRTWLLNRFEISSMNDIPNELYDMICEAVEGLGELPTDLTREPGADG